MADAPKSAAVSLGALTAGVDQALVSGGLNDGIINPDQGDLTWFDGYDRVEPGHIGTSVLAAHVTYEGEPDVFSDLEDMSLGDPITIGYADGSEATFVLTAAEVIDKTEVQTDPRVWGAQDDAQRLVLITCDDALGFREDGHRTANLVVFASPMKREKNIENRASHTQRRRLSRPTVCQRQEQPLSLTRYRQPRQRGPSHLAGRLGGTDCVNLPRPGSGQGRISGAVAQERASSHRRNQTSLGVGNAGTACQSRSTVRPADTAIVAG